MIINVYLQNQLRYSRERAPTSLLCKYVVMFSRWSGTCFFSKAGSIKESSSFFCASRGPAAGAEPRRRVLRAGEPRRGVLRAGEPGVGARPGTARSGKLYRARSRLYQSQILQVNMRLKALAEIYTMHSFAQLRNLIFCQNFAIFFAKFCKISKISEIFARSNWYVVLKNVILSCAKEWIV